MHENSTRHGVVCVIFDSFCKTVLRNKSKNLARSHFRHAKKEYSADKVAESLYMDQYPSDENQIIVAELVCCIQNDHLYEALLQIPHQELIVLILHFWEDWTDQQIADRFQVTTRTIRNWRRNSLIHLRNILMQNPLPLKEWACFKDDHASPEDTSTLTMQALWVRVAQEHIQFLVTIYKRWMDEHKDEDFDEYRKAAMPGLD